MAYAKKTWVSGETPLSADNFNHMEDGIAAAHEDISGLNTNTLLKTFTIANTDRVEISAISGQAIQQGKKVLIDCIFTQKYDLGGEIYLISANRSGLPPYSSKYSIQPYCIVGKGTSVDELYYTGTATVSKISDGTSGIVTSVRKAGTYCFHLEYFID